MFGQPVVQGAARKRLDFGPPGTQRGLAQKKCCFFQAAGVRQRRPCAIWLRNAGVRVGLSIASPAAGSERQRAGSDYGRGCYEVPWGCDRTGFRDRFGIQGK